MVGNHFPQSSGFRHNALDCVLVVQRSAGKPLMLVPIGMPSFARSSIFLNSVSIYAINRSRFFAYYNSMYLFKHAKLWLRNEYCRAHCVQCFVLLQPFQLPAHANRQLSPTLELFAEDTKTLGLSFL